MGTDMIGGDRITQNTMNSKSKKKSMVRVDGWVDGLVKRDFITHSGSSEHSLDSESKIEPSVAITKDYLLLQNTPQDYKTDKQLHQDNLKATLRPLQYHFKTRLWIKVFSF